MLTVPSQDVKALLVLFVPLFKLRSLIITGTLWFGQPHVAYSRRHRAKLTRKGDAELEMAAKPQRCVVFQPSYRKADGTPLTDEERCRLTNFWREFEHESQVEWERKRHALRKRSEERRQAGRGHSWPLDPEKIEILAYLIRSRVRQDRSKWRGYAAKAIGALLLLLLGAAIERYTGVIFAPLDQFLSPTDTRIAEPKPSSQSGP